MLPACKLAACAVTLLPAGAAARPGASVAAQQLRSRRPHARSCLRAIRMPGPVEALHIAGASLAAAQGPRQAQGAAAGEGCLVLLDFADGLAAAQAARARAARRAVAAAAQQAGGEGACAPPRSAHDGAAGAGGASGPALSHTSAAARQPQQARAGKKRRRPGP